MFALSNMQVVCLQGLGVGLQLQRVDDDTIWNLDVVPLRTLYCFLHCIYRVIVRIATSSWT